MELLALPLYSVTFPLGKIVNVFNDCVTNPCDCVFELGGVRSQLKPCRFASIGYNGSCDWGLDYKDLLGGGGGYRRVPYSR